MTQLSVSQINNLRKRPQSTKLYLSFYQPKTLFQVRVTGSYNQGDSQINYYSPTSGTYFNVYPNLTARIGSTPGADDVGELRVRSITGTYVNFAENEINWQQGQYIAFIDYINVEAIYPRIIQDPSNQTSVIFYKDYDIPYSNQNTNYGTFACAGPHRAGFIVTGAYSTYWSSTGTYNLLGDSLTFSWAFEGGTPTGSTARDPGFVRYTTPGHYKTRLIVTDSVTGVTDTTYRYVSAYQKPNQGTNNPIEAWEMSELSGSRGEGGYTTHFKIMSILPELQPHTLTVIFAEDTYGGNILSLGGNSQNNESIVFVGYVLQDSIKFNYQYSTMEFDVGSVSEIMREAEGFSVSCESKATATTWYELQEMTVQKALYHYLRWHSTVLNVNDFQYTGDDRYVQYLDTDRESLFDAVDNFLRKGLLGSLVTDRQGKLWAEISHFGLQTPFTSIRQGMTLNKQDWMGEPTIQERRDTDTSFIELGGIAYYGVTTNTFSALLSNAPGNAPYYHGRTETEEGLILISQAQLNQVAANYLAYKNTQYHEISLPINGNYRNLDIAPQEQQFLVITPSDTIRGLNLQGQPYQIDSMSWHYNSANQSFYPDVTLEAMATGTVSQTILIPVTPPYQQSGFDYPSLHLPTLPVFNPSSAVGPSSPTKILIHDNTVGLIYSDNFDAALPDWITVNGGLTAAQYLNINVIGVCPNGAIYVGCAQPSVATHFLARAPYVGAPFTVITLPGTFLRSFAVNPTQQEQIAFSSSSAGDPTWPLYVGTYASWTTGADTNTYQGSACLSWGNNEWLMTKYASGGQSSIRISANGGSLLGTNNFNISPSHLRATNSLDFLTYHEENGVNAVIQGKNDVQSAKEVNTGNTILISLGGTDILIADCDPTGQYIMARGLGGLGQGKAKSSDFGATWVAIPGLFPSGGWYFKYAGSSESSVTASRWIAVSSTIQYSTDFGISWVEKTGTLRSIAPFPNMTMTRIISNG